MTLKQVKAQMDENGMLYFTAIPQLNAGENLSAQLCIDVDESFLQQQQGSKYYFEFKCADGKRYVTPMITPANGQLTYALEGGILYGDGNIAVQVAVKNGDYIFKSQTAEFPVSSSINASIPVAFRKDFLTVAQQVFEQVKTGQEALNQLAQELRQMAEDGSFKGDKGEQGDAGFVLWGDEQSGSQGNVSWKVVS